MKTNVKKTLMFFSIVLFSVSTSSIFGGTNGKPENGKNQPSVSVEIEKKVFCPEFLLDNLNSTYNCANVTVRIDDTWWNACSNSTHYYNFKLKFGTNVVCSSGAVNQQSYTFNYSPGSCFTTNGNGSYTVVVTDTYPTPDLDSEVEGFTWSDSCDRPE